MIEADYGEIDPAVVRVLRTEFADLTYLARHPLVDFGTSPTFFDFLLNFANSYKYEHLLRQEAGNDPEDFNKHALIVNGFPMVGKSRGILGAKRFLTRYLQLDLGIDPQDPYHPIREVNHEVGGEQRAIKFGRIKTRIDLPFSDEELAAANEELEFTLDEAIGDHVTGILLIEAPGNTAINVGGTWVGRKVASEALVNFTQKKGLFEKYRHPLAPKYTSWAAGFRGGEVLRFVMIHARDSLQQILMKDAEIDESGQEVPITADQKLKKAVEVASYFNLPLPTSLTEVEEMSRGASLKQMNNIDEQGESMVDKLVSIRAKLNVPDPQTYQALLDLRIYDFHPRPDSLLQRALPAIIQYYMQDKHNLGLYPWQSIVVDSNPSFEELGLTGDKLEALRKYLLEQNRIEEYPIP